VAAPSCVVKACYIR